MLTYTPANSVFDGPVTNLLSVLCILIEALSRAHEKVGGGAGGGGGGGGGEALMTSNSAILLVISRAAGAASKAAKGLSAGTERKITPL